jgi:hypothetical protein
MPFANFFDICFVLRKFGTHERFTNEKRTAVDTSDRVWLSGGITGGTGNENITIDTRREDTKESVIDVLPDETRNPASKFSSGAGTEVRR